MRFSPFHAADGRGWLANVFTHPRFRTDETISLKKAESFKE
jgi:hypothetical protein